MRISDKLYRMAFVFILMFTHFAECMYLSEAFTGTMGYLYGTRSEIVPKALYAQDKFIYSLVSDVVHHVTLNKQIELFKQKVASDFEVMAGAPIDHHLGYCFERAALIVLRGPTWSKSRLGDEIMDITHRLLFRLHELKYLIKTEDWNNKFACDVKLDLRENIVNVHAVMRLM